MVYSFSHVFVSAVYATLGWKKKYVWNRYGAAVCCIFFRV